MTPSALTTSDLESHRPGPAVEIDDLLATVPAALAERGGAGDDPFVIGSTFRLTFAEADRLSAELAGRLLAAGVGKGTHVALLFSNEPQWVISWLAIVRIGAVSVPLSTFSPGPELARVLRHTDVHALLMGDRFAGASLSERIEAGLPAVVESGPDLQLAQVPFLRWINVAGRTPENGGLGEPSHWSKNLPAPVTPEIVRAAEAQVVAADRLAIISTSGATAAPKSVVHTHGSLVRHAAILAAKREMTRADRIYSPMPFFWVGGLTMVLLASLTSGAAAVVQERFEPGEALDLIEGERVTQVSCWPNAARAMADHPTFASRDLHGVRGGMLWEALPAAQRPSSPTLAPNVLGMTETGGPHTSPDDPYAPLPLELEGTFGQPLLGMDHRIAGLEADDPPGDDAPGEILVRGRYLMDGIYRQERDVTFTADGWYRTGDLGWFGSDGHLRFVGRATSMIKTAGSNVAPAEVEAALLELPGVRSAFVFGVPAGDRGEEVAAVVVAEHDVPLDPASVRQALIASISGYKVPRHVRVLGEAELPMLPTGKADLIALRALFAEA